jgi:site-specific DNA recombinase
MAVRAAIEARISLDKEGEGAGVERQLEDCRELCAQRGFDVVGEYVDNSVSAFSGKKRPQFERLLHDMANGEIDVVIVWKVDRLARRGKDLQRFLNAAEQHHVQLISCTEPDFTGSTGLLLLRILNGFAEHESNVKSERVARKLRAQAELGKPHAGGRRTFGYTRDFEPHPDEAPLLREAVSRVITGDSARTIAADWTQRGIRTVTGRPWVSGNFLRMLRSPVFAGLRTYHGQLIDGTWEALVPRERWEQMRATLDSRHVTKGRTVTRHMLTGLAVCGKCGARLSGDEDRAPEEGHQHGRVPLPQEGGCGQLTMRAHLLEEIVTVRFLERADTPAFQSLVERAQDGQVGVRDEAMLLREDEAALEQLTKDHYVEHLISRPAFMAAKRDLDERIAQRRLKLAQSSSPLAALTGATGSLAALWEERGAAWRRSVLEAAVSEIVVQPVGKNRYQDRVEIRWAV